MKAVVFRRPYELAVEDVPEPTVTAPHEVVVEVTKNSNNQAKTLAVGISQLNDGERG